MFTIIESENVPAPKGHYSQAIECNGLIFTSVQSGVGNGNKETDFETQLHTIFNNLQKLLSDAGSNLNKVIKLTIYITDIDNWGKADEIVKYHFKDHKPARGVLTVSALKSNAKVSVEVIAEK